MSRIVLSSLDEKLVEEAMKTHAVKNISVAVDNTVENKFKAQALGLDHDALIGAENKPVEPAPAPAKKVSKPKKVEAKKDDKPKSE